MRQEAFLCSSPARRVFAWGAKLHPAFWLPPNLAYLLQGRSFPVAPLPEGDAQDSLSRPPLQLGASRGSGFHQGDKPPRHVIRREGQDAWEAPSVTKHVPWGSLSTKPEPPGGVASYSDSVACPGMMAIKRHEDGSCSLTSPHQIPILELHTEEITTNSG